MNGVMVALILLAGSVFAHGSVRLEVCNITTGEQAAGKPCIWVDPGAVTLYRQSDHPGCTMIVMDGQTIAVMGTVKEVGCRLNPSPACLEKEK